MQKESLITVIMIIVSFTIFAQTSEYKTIEHRLYSGLFIDNLNGELSSVFESTVEVENALAIRFAISEMDLGDSSFIRIRSVKENRFCDFTADMLERWNYTTPFFNGQNWFT